MPATKKPVRIVFLGAGGSTGKTTEAVNLGCALAARGKKVRWIDGDGQGDTSQYLQYQHPPYVLGEALGQVEVYPDPTTKSGLRVPTLREIEVPIYRETEEEAAELGGLAPQNDEQAEWLKRLTLIPSGTGASGTTLGSAVTFLEREQMGAEKALKALDSIDDGRPDDEIPDYEFFDLHGTVGPMTYLALRWASRGSNEHGRSGAIVVVTPDDKSTGRHLKEAKDIVAEVNEFHPIELLAIIPTRVRPVRHGKFYVVTFDRLRESEEYGHLVTNTVRESVYAPESFAAREPLLMWVPNEGITTDQESVLDWLIEHKVVTI
ncbi:AAA family ATPase [Nocardia farcinica]|uniref:ParA family protein n=1 Tax=Nocardia farcinica TaxID=37329 RepID=UPI0018951988|nr:AAA family ATPase [Nocardia farcinica]MBF6422667.1 AAA family ATPase [Nocardia farcinica]MBF6434357.1 AAA family ATPase [Nocardia farcinica]MBF6505442.1 AAA family ATPase [Nocardia farcinica]